MSDKASVLVELAKVLANQDQTRPLAHRLCAAGASIIGAAGAALTLQYGTDTRVTVCATDETAERLEDLQDVLGEGPGPTAYLTGRQVEVDVPSAADVRWPQFAAAAARSLGSRRLCAIPVRPDSSVLGVLTCHQAPHLPLPADAGMRQFIADAIGVALLQDPEAYAGDTSGPWSTRALIHQATGMVVAQLRVPPEDALALLRAHAFTHDASLGDVADLVLRRDLDFSGVDDDGPVA
jgi:hypothetical protein